MGIYSVKPRFQRLLKPVQDLCVRLKIHPTTINIVALLLSILGGVALYFSGEYILFLAYIPAMAFVRTALNALDGMVARELRVENQEFGEVLNEFLDRISDAAIFFGLALASYTDVILGGVVTLLILLNSYLSIVSKAAGGSRQYGGVMGKADRMIYLGVMAVIILISKDYSFGNYLLWFVGIGTIITMMQRFQSIKRELYR